MWSGEDYEIVDPRPLQASAPYTFFLPSAEETADIVVGDLIKATVRQRPPSERWDAEKLWFTVVDVQADNLECRLESDPVDMPLFTKGRVLVVPRAAVTDIIHQDEAVNSAYDQDRPQEYWSRCFVDRAVLRGEQRAAVIYREQPRAVADEPFQDSGWRIKARQPALWRRWLTRPLSDYVALGAVLNKDDSWLHLLDAPIGSVFRRTDDGIWVKERD